MKKISCIALFSLLFNFMFAQDLQKLLVRSGDTLRIETTETTVNEFIMEDNSTIQLEGIKDWILNARTARIGNSCKIIGVGKSGDNGTAGIQGAEVSDCQGGSEGSKGTSGERGSDGINISIKTELINLGILTINSNGGIGGNGGTGGKGGRGGNADISKDCKGGNGGIGGKGGDAGQGGNGGHIKIEYCENGKKPKFNEISNFNVINTLSNAGSNGRVGDGGERGDGGKGREEDFGLFTVKKGPGGPGSRGKDGDNPPQATNGSLSSKSINCSDCLIDVREETYAIIIATSKTESGEGDNEVFVEDAMKFAEVLKENYSFDSIYEKYNVSNKELVIILTTLGQTYGENSKIFIYLSGHGLEYNSFPSFNTKDNYPLPFKTIYSYVEDAPVERILLIVDACYSGKIFDNKSNSINAYIPHKSRLIYPRETCGKRALTVISSGFDNETVPARDFIDELIFQIKSNQDDAITAETLFYRIKQKDFKSQKPVFGKSKSCIENQCIESDFIFFKQ